MSIRKKFIGSDQVDQTKILLDSNGALRSKNSEGQAISLFKLNTSDVLQFLQLPQVSIAPTSNSDVTNKQYVDGAIATAKGEEQSRALAAEASLETAIATERSRAMGVEQSLSTALNYVISNVDAGAIDSLVEIVNAFQTADGSLQGAISNLTLGEQSRALAAEASLQSAIDDLDDAKANLALDNLADVAINTSLLPDASLSISLGSAEKAFTDAFLKGSVQIDLVDEVEGNSQALVYADSASFTKNWENGNTTYTSFTTSSIETNFNSAFIKGNFASGENEGDLIARLELQSYVDGIAVAAMPQIDGHVTTKKYVDQEIDAELSRAEAVEQSLMTAIDLERTRAEAAEYSLEQAILAEESRALAAEETFLTLDGSRSMAGNLKMENHDVEWFYNYGMNSTQAKLGQISLGQFDLGFGFDAYAQKAVVSSNLEVEIRHVGQSGVSDIVIDHTGIKLTAFGSIQVAAVAGGDIVVSGVATPVGSSDAVNKGYLDGIESSLADAISSLSSAVGQDLQGAIDSLQASIEAEQSRALGIEEGLQDQLDAMEVEASAYESFILVQEEGGPNGKPEQTITLEEEAVAGSIMIMIDRVMLAPVDDFSVSGDTISFLGAVAWGGAEALEAGDKVHVWYKKSVNGFPVA